MRAITFAAPLLALALAAPAHADLVLPRTSPNAGATQTIGTTDLSIKYCRPSVKGRAIWGALVPYDKPWRTGANEIPQFTSSTDVQIEGQPLPAGTYGLVTIPGTSQWTIVFSKQNDMWGSFDYDSTKDQLRVRVTPAEAPMLEAMQFTFDDPTPTSTTLALRWEKVRVPVRVTVDVVSRVMAAARDSVAAAKADDWRTPYRAASYALDNARPEASAWAATALQRKENFQTLALAARMSAKGGRTKEAVDQMRRAIALGKADKDVEAEMIAPMEKLLADWTAKK